MKWVIWQNIRSEKREFCLFQHEEENKFFNSEAKSPAIYVIRPSQIQNHPVQDQKRGRRGSRKWFKEEDAHTPWALKVPFNPVILTLAAYRQDQPSECKQNNTSAPGLLLKDFDLNILECRLGTRVCKGSSDSTVQPRLRVTDFILNDHTRWTYGKISGFFIVTFHLAPPKPKEESYSSYWLKSLWVINLLTGKVPVDFTKLVLPQEVSFFYLPDHVTDG